MRKYLLAMLASLALGACVLAAPPNAPETLQPGQTLFVGQDGKAAVGTFKTASTSTSTRTAICPVDRTWTDFNGDVRNMDGTVVVRSAWVRDTRAAGSDDDVVWFDWGYNWPGTGAGTGTGISFTNFTNYVLRIDSVKYVNVASGTIASAVSPLPSGVANSERIHVWGESHMVNTSDWEDWHAHSYWHNAPRIRVYFSSTNWDYNYRSQSLCDSYVQGQPAA